MKIETAAILGGAEFKKEDREYQDAFEVSKILAQERITIFNGGGPGIMRASTQGAHQGSGQVIGVTYYPKYQHANFEGRDKENAFDQEIITENYFARTKKLLEMGKVHIIFRGGSGTVSEFGMSWALSRIHDGHSIPIILFGDFWVQIIEALKKHMYLRPGETKYYDVVQDPGQVLLLIEKYRRELGDDGLPRR